MQEIFILSVSFVVYLPCIPFEATVFAKCISLCNAEISEFQHADAARQVRRMFSLKLTWMSVNNYFNDI